MRTEHRETHGAAPWLRRGPLTALLGLAAIAAAVISSVAWAASATGGFTLTDKPGEHLDVALGGRLVGRFMYAYDQSTAERLHDTYKPYLHIFDETGTAPITKGPGGNFSHHRGIFVGWKVTTGGKQYDFWHLVKDPAASKAAFGKPHIEMVHQKFIEQKAGPQQAIIVSAIAWKDPEGKTVVDEQRTHLFHNRPLPTIALVDLETRLKAVADLSLGGDPEHAGVHYRPANEVAARETAYLFPKEGADPKKDLDYPWVGETYSLNGKKYSVVHMNHPANPKGTVYSAYRDYGRFGAFFTKDMKAGEVLTLRYRFLVTAGELPDAATIQKCWDEFAGVASPTPAPKTTLKQAQPMGGARPAAPNAPAAQKAP